MSEENVEVRNEAVRRFFAAFEDEDDAFRAALHPEIEWYPIEENRTPTRGIDAALWNRNQWLDTWEEHQLDLEEVIEDGDDVVTSTSKPGVRAAAWRPMSVSSRNSRGGTARSPTSTTTKIEQRPSKPPGCPSKGSERVTRSNDCGRRREAVGLTPLAQR
jgi:ketosteroid isomerase-like protein